ncbi:MAG: PIN domain-containing protein [Methanosarcinaceae archaeon]|nr:PIN domain-containing protein [Methanosarcinaceae archaeon]
MIFLDSSYYIAIVDKRDQWHQKALELSNYFENKDIVVSSFIISEVLTEIGNRSSGKVAYNLFNYFEDSCRVVQIDKDLLIESVDVFLKYDGTLSLADASSIVIMNNMKISEIVSFDSDFDKVDNLNRIHKLDS